MSVSFKAVLSLWKPMGFMMSLRSHCNGDEDTCRRCPLTELHGLIYGEGTK